MSAVNLLADSCHVASCVNYFVCHQRAAWDLPKALCINDLLSPWLSQISMNWLCCVIELSLHACLETADCEFNDLTSVCMHP